MKKIKTVAVHTSTGLPYTFEERDSAENQLRFIQYDATGKMLFEVTKVYDKQGALQEEKHWNSAKQVERDYQFTYQYDSEGRMIECLRTDRDGALRKTVYDYLADGRKTDSIFQYDRLIQINLYDTEGRLTNRSKEQAGTSTSYEYDAEGNILAQRNELKEGHSILKYTNHYDDQKRLVQVDWNANPAWRFTYGTDGEVSRKIEIEMDGKISQDLAYHYTFFE